MRRGTTDIHRFELPYRNDVIKTLQIIYKQHGETVLEKSLDDCAFDDADAIVALTQEETFLFTTDYEATVQVRLLTNEGEAISSDVEIFEVEESLSEEVLV